MIFPADFNAADIENVLDSLPVATNVTVVVGSTVVVNNLEPDEIEITEELLAPVAAEPASATNIIENLQNNEIVLEHSVVIPIVTASNIDTIDSLASEVSSDVSFSPIQIGEIPIEPIIVTESEPVLSLSDVALPEAKPEMAVILLPEDLTVDEVKTVLAALPIENDVVDVYQGANLILDNVAATELASATIPEDRVLK